MLNKNTDKQVHSFLTFLNVPVSEALSQELTDFMDGDEANQSREVIFDRGQLLLIENGKQTTSHTLESSNDRVVKFDGHHIREINPFAYINDSGYQMKGDDSAGARRSGGSSASYSNNNNNNNNNNNG